jgi:hypothetical protein
MALMLRHNAESPGDHQVMHGEWQVGQIDKRPSFTGKGAKWIWALNGVPASIPAGIRLAGVSETLNEAESELKKSWEQWLEWANLQSAASDGTGRNPKF